MTPSRKKLGVAFWATVAVVVVLLVYPLSFGPACWISSRAPQWDIPWTVTNFIYSPVLRAWSHDGTIPDAIGWYGNLGAAAELTVGESDGTVYLLIIASPP